MKIKLPRNEEAVPGQLCCCEEGSYTGVSSRVKALKMKKSSERRVCDEPSDWPDIKSSR